MQRYRYRGTVIESPWHGPQLCAVVMASLPPQGRGPDVVGWDWSTVDAESMGGTTWGEYEVIGTYDGERFTLTEPPRAFDSRAATVRQRDRSFDIPCPPPPDGWRPVDVERTTQDALDAVLAVAEGAPWYAGAWVRDLHGGGVEEDHEPTDLVLVVKCAGDLDDCDNALRELWGGALCVSLTMYSLAELEAIQRAVIDDVSRPLSGVIDIVANRVEIECFHVPPELRERIDARYGPGTVVLSSWLRPVD